MNITFSSSHIFKISCFCLYLIISFQDGVVRLMGNHLIIPGGTRTIDATGKYIMPGGIDMNVHLQRPGFGTQTIDDFYQGTKAALAGGTTMVVDMVIPEKEETLFLLSNLLDILFTFLL